MILELVSKSMALATLIFFLSISSIFPTNTNLQWTNSVKMGMQWGLSKEMVFPSYRNQTNNKYLSLLTWELKQIPTIGLSSKIEGIRKLGLSLDFDAAIPEVPTGYMNDYDWFFTDKEWSHWTRHNIALRWGFMANLSIQWKIKETRNLFFYTGISYHLDSWSWTDSFIENIYSHATNEKTNVLPRPFDAANGDKFRTYVNTIDYGSYVDYEVAFHTLLATFQLKLKFNRIFTSLTARVGPALIFSLDNHKQRISSTTGETGLLFYNVGLGFPWFDGTLELGFIFSDNLSLTICGDISWMPETLSDTTMYDGKGNYLSSSKGFGGFDLYKGGISVKISWMQNMVPPQK